MAGSKEGVSEFERLDLTKDGRGFILKSDDANLHYDAAAYLDIFPSGAGETNPALGYLRVRYMSGSTYGATGATGYIPFYGKKA